MSPRALDLGPPAYLILLFFQRGWHACRGKQLTGGICFCPSEAGRFGVFEDSTHDARYTARAPTTLCLENLVRHDSGSPQGWQGPPGVWCSPGGRGVPPTRGVLEHRCQGGPRTEDSSRT